MYTDSGLQTVSEQIPYLKEVANKQEADRRLKGYLNVFDTERVGASNSRQFNALDMKPGSRLGVEQQERDDSKATPV